MPTAASLTPEILSFELTLPEDRTSLQRALNELLSLIAGDRISDKRATLLFRVLSLASRNLASLARDPDAVTEPQPAAIADDQPEASSTIVPPELFHHDRDGNNPCHSERSEEPPYFVRSATPSTISELALPAPEKASQIDASAAEPSPKPHTFLDSPIGPTYREKIMQRRAHLQQQAAQFPVMSQRPPATLST